MVKESLNVVRERLAEFLPRLSVRVKNDGKAGLNNIHKLSEPVIRNLMNTLYGLELKLEGKVNAGGFDLCDTENHVLVQVTGNCTDQKIKDCLRTTADRVAKEPELNGAELYIAFLTSDEEEIKKLRKKTAAKMKKGELKAEGFRFTAESGILCLQDFVQFLTDDLGPDGEELTADQVHSIQNLLDKLTPEAQPPRELYLPFSALGDGAFVGREDKLAQLEAKLRQSGNNPIVVSGLGGMGKTTLVTRFCAGYTGGKVYFVRFRENFTRTVAEGVAAGMEGCKDREPDPERDYAEAMALLRRCGKADLLVIDNADAPDDDFGKLLTDPAWAELRKLPLRLILTTRCEVSGAIQVGKMDNRTLYRFFENQELTLDASQMDKLIGAVQGHTMTVELIARTLKRTRTLTVEKLLSALGTGELKEQKFRAVAVERNGRVEQEGIYEHLRKLFNVAEISEDARDLLRNLVLLPEGGMDIRILEALLDDVGLETLNQQIDHGWLAYDQDRGFVSMHPVIRMVCRRELEPDDDNCEEFINGAWDYFDPNQYDAEVFRQLAELFSQAAEMLPDPWGNNALFAGSLWNKLGQPAKAIQYEQQIIRRCQTLQDDPESLSIVYNNLGNTFVALGDYGNALEYCQKALSLLQQVYPEDHMEMVLAHNNLGQVYGLLGDFEKALSHTRKALQIQEKEDPENLYNLGKFHNNLCNLHIQLGDSREALSHALEAMALWEKTLPAEHPELATLYNNAGLSYFGLADYEESEKYMLRTLEIWEKKLPEDHPDLAKACMNLGRIYADTGKAQEALTYLLRGQKIYERVYSGDHPDLAMCYGNLGMVYYNLEMDEEAWEFTTRGLQMLEKLVPEDHPNLALLYNNLGNILVRREEYREALKLIQKALDIWKKTLPPDHPNFALGYLNAGEICQLLKEQTMALRYKLAAVRIYEKHLPGDHPMLAKVCSSTASAFAEENQYHKAGIYRKKAVNIYEKLLSPEDPALAELYNSLGFDYFKSGNLSGSWEYVCKAVRLARRILPEDNQTRRIYERNAVAVHRMLREKAESEAKG